MVHQINHVGYRGVSGRTPKVVDVMPAPEKLHDLRHEVRVLTALVEKYLVGIQHLQVRQGLRERFTVRLLRHVKRGR